MRQHLAGLSPRWLADVVASFDLDRQRGALTDARQLAAKVLGVNLDTFYRHKGDSPGAT